MKNSQNTFGSSDNANPNNEAKRNSQSDHPHAAAAQTVDIVRHPFSAVGEDGEQCKNDEGDIPDTQCAKHHIFHIRHVTEFTLVVQRTAIFEFQIAEIGNIGTVDKILQGEGRPLQAVLLGEAVFIRGEIGHSVFDVDEDGAEQNAQGRADEGNGDEEGGEVGEDGLSFHDFFYYVIASAQLLLFATKQSRTW